VDTERKAVNGFIYIYELALRVDSGVNVFNTDEVSARTSGLLGEKSVAIIPRPPKTGEPLRLVNDEIIYATEGGTVEETLQEFKELSDKIEASLDGILDALTKLREKKFWENLGDASKNIKEITDSLNKPDQWSETLANIHEVSKKVNKSWDKVDEVIDKANLSMTDVNSITARIAVGEGSIGKIVARDDLYMRFISLTNKAETILNDVNHYGVLFHLDKGWQRLRARRLNLMQKLCTPQEFRNFFNDEIDQISTSLSRVAMVMEGMGCQPLQCCGNLLQNIEFSKVYSELIRRVEAIEESVKMYNQQIVDTALYETELCEDCCQ
jgi:phospholipid/cholesterol/gamma-HCH transport system substrate-binding protein